MRVPLRLPRISEHPITAIATGEVRGASGSNSRPVWRSHRPRSCWFVTLPTCAPFEGRSRRVRPAISERARYWSADVLPPRLVEGVIAQGREGAVVCSDGRGAFGPVVPRTASTAPHPAEDGRRSVGDTRHEGSTPGRHRVGPTSCNFRPRRAVLAGRSFTFPVEAFIDWFGQGTRACPVDRRRTWRLPPGSGDETTGSRRDAQAGGRRAADRRRPAFSDPEVRRWRSVVYPGVSSDRRPPYGRVTRAEGNRSLRGYGGQPPTGAFWIKLAQRA